MTLAQIKKREQQLVAAVTKAFSTALRNLRDELRAEQGEFKYCGVWEAGKRYKLGNFVTFRGGLWHANRDTKGGSEDRAERPGDDSGAFQLAVKSGRE